MALNLKQSLKLSQSLVMTPQLQQAIKLLQLNRMELAEVVNQELVENPILEEQGATSDDEQVSSAEAEQKRDEEAFSQEKTEEQKLVEGKDDFNWEQYIEEYNNYTHSTASMKEVNEDLPSFENALSKTTSLEDHLRWQISMSTLGEDEERFAELVVGNLNRDGYLQHLLKTSPKKLNLIQKMPKRF